LIQSKEPFDEVYCNNRNNHDVGQELGVSPGEMVGCMKQSGMKRGQNLSEEQRAEVGASLLNCLQKKNPDLTKEKFVSTMIRFRKR